MIVDSANSKGIKGARMTIEEGLRTQDSEVDGKLVFKGFPSEKIQYEVTCNGFLSKKGSFNITTANKDNTLNSKLKKSTSHVFFGNVRYPRGNQRYDRLEKVRFEVRIGEIDKDTTTDKYGKYKITFDRNEINSNVEQRYRIEFEKDSFKTVAFEGKLSRNPSTYIHDTTMEVLDNTKDKDAISTQNSLEKSNRETETLAHANKINKKPQKKIFKPTIYLAAGFTTLSIADWLYLRNRTNTYYSLHERLARAGQQDLAEEMFANAQQANRRQRLRPTLLMIAGGGLLATGLWLKFDKGNLNLTISDNGLGLQISF